MATTTSTNVKFLTGDINKLKDASSEAGAIIFAVDKTNKKGKIYYNADNTTRVEMTTDEAESAKKWSKAVDFTIHDAGDQHYGSAASVDGSSDVTLYLPDTISANLMGNVTGNLAGNVTGNLTGNVTGDVTGNLTGNVTGNLSGNATTADKWKTAVNFRISDSEVKHTGIDTLVDGSSTTGYTLHLPPTIEATLEGNASTSTKWLNPQKVYVTLGTASTTTTIQGGSSSAQTIGVNGILGGANGGTGQSSWTANRLVYSSTTAKLANASSIFIDNNHIGINATTASVSGNAYNLYVNGTTYLNGVLTSASRIESINTIDSAYSKDEQAALVIEGGATIEKQLSAKQIRIDNNQAAKSCTLKFNEAQNCLEFTFQ